MPIEINKFLRETGMKPSAFGRKACGDPRLIDDLRNGRTLRPETTEKIKRFITQALDNPSVGSY